MLSGGIDSAYTLLRLLRESEDTILAHHIHMVNAENRHKVEADSCRRIVEYCNQHHRKVSYSESAVDHRGMLFMGFDMVTVGFEAGIVAHSYFLATKTMPDRWTVGTCLEEGHWMERYEHVQACCAANCFPNEPPEFFTLPLVPKREEMEYLPMDYLALTWTCRRPVWTGSAFVACGTCKTCELMKGIQVGRPAG